MWAVLLAVTQMDSFAMRAIDNGADHACSVSYAVFKVQITAYNFYMVAIDCILIVNRKVFFVFAPCLRFLVLRSR